MTSANWRLLLLLLFFTSSTSSAWFGTKHKSSGASSSSSGRFRSDESSSSSSSSSPFLLNRFRSGSAVVFPVHGNVYPVGFYNVTLNIGQPPRPYFLDIDTGSDLTWLQCDAPCSRCSQTPHPLYRPSNDLVPCRHALCASLHHNDNYDCEVPHQCDYEVEYADHYSSLGVLLHDVYTLNFTNGVQLKVRMALGCGYDQIFPDPSHHPLDGMLGLGRGKTSLTSQLNSQGLVRNVVGHSGAAELLFGGKRTGVGNLHATFDTGSSYTYFNSNAYQLLISWLRKESGGKPLKEAHGDQTLPLCWHGKRPFKSIYEVRKYFKPITLSFSSNGRSKALFEIPPEGYLIISQNMGNVCLGILNGSEVGMGDLNLIGDISMLNKVMVFDNDKQLIGWTSADCDRVPKSRDVSI
ncbi:Aspartic proteinase [Vigna angularis]|uniref:Aspartic proteinase n=1 Tax=Phaseolus angularis TaxID=3914 RepID=A0A8T0KJ74_PHAAN|nr:Aspartic proteinase [Vigna angularis]